MRIGEEYGRGKDHHKMPLGLMQLGSAFVTENHLQF